MQKLIPTAIIIAGVLIAGAVVYTNYPEKPGETPGGIPGETPGEIVSPQEAAERAIDFINQNLLRGRATASLVEALEENGLYKFKFAIEGREMESYITFDGKLFFPEGIDLTEVEPMAQEQGQTIGNFSVTSDEVCKENGKPIVYFFGLEGCGYCKWEHPIIEEVAAKFGGEISFHNNMDTDADREVFQKYSTGGVPTLVLGCKYYRVGAGKSDGEELETKNLTAIICKLTGNKPADVCNQVQDLVNQIEDY